MKGYLGGVQQVQETFLPLSNLVDPPCRKLRTLFLIKIWHVGFPILNLNDIYVRAALAKFVKLDTACQTLGIHFCEGLPDLFFIRCLGNL